MTNDDWVKLHLRHSEMHLSFAVAKTIGDFQAETETLVGSAT